MKLLESGVDDFPLLPNERAFPESANLKSDAESDSRRRLLLRAMMALEITVGVILFGLMAPQFRGDWHIFLVLLALNLVAESVPISVYGDSRITTGFVFTLPIIALFGAPGVAILAPLEGTVRTIGRDSFDIRFVRRVTRPVIVYVAATAVYTSIAPVDPATFSDDVVAGGLAATAAAFALSAVLITFGVSLETGQSLLAVWANNRWVAFHYAAFGVVGLGFLASYMALGYAGMIVFIVPAFMLRFSTKQYVDKTAENVEKLKEQNSALRTANVEIRRVSDELRVTYKATLEALVNALEARDQETKGHSVRVARYMTNIAEALGVQPGTSEWIDMQHGALLHDVGKIGVRDSILLKPGKLTPEEWGYMRRHPEIGYGILKEVKFLQGAAEIVLAHHERWDGRGYPRGLRNEEIPLGSRIFMVVDTFDTMTSDRVYRKALTSQDALEEILRCRGTQFDPLVVEAFLDIFDEWVVECEDLQKLTALRSAA